MRDFKKERHVRRSVAAARRSAYLRAGAGMLGLLALLFIAGESAHAAWGMYQKFAEASAADAAAQNELADEQAQYDSMSASVAALQTPEGQEAAMRERYGVARPGEGEIDIVAPASTTAPAATSTSGFLSRLWHAIFAW